MTTLRSAPGGRAGPTSWPLTPIEELDLYLESAAEPSLIQLEILVRGHLDAAAAGVGAGRRAGRGPGRAAAAGRRLRVAPALRWEAAGDAGDAGDAGQLTVASWRSTGQLAALREWVSAWPIPLRDRAARLILAAGPSMTS